MSSLVHLLDAHKTLQKKATRYYREIEQWYNDDNVNSHTFVPMNVPANIRGSSQRPGLKNGFILARTYLKLSNLNLPDLIRDLTQCIECFSPSFYGIEQCTKKPPTPDKQVALIPDPFLQPLYTFQQALIEFKEMVDTFKPSPNEINIDMHALFDRYADFLMDERGYNPHVVNAACEQALSQLDRSTEWEINWQYLALFNEHFYNKMTVRSFAYHFNDTSKQFVREKIEIDFDKEVKKLSQLFVEHLPDQALICLFKEKFSEKHFQNHLSHALSNAVHWHPSSLWSREQREHHQTFSATLEDVKHLRKY